MGLTCTRLQNFSVVMNQHSPVSDSAVHFLVTLKRPEQRQLDQQRKVCPTSIRAQRCCVPRGEDLPFGGAAGTGVCCMGKG